MFLVILGWLAIVAITCYFCFATWALFVLGMGFAGRLSTQFFIVLFITLVLIYGSFHFAPFTFSYQG